MSIMYNLPEATRLWLEYQIACGRKDLISEASLVQPMGEYLLTRQLGRLYSEKDHPGLVTTRAGRNPQVDFVIADRQTGEDEIVLESKWLKCEGPFRTLVIADLLRLERYATDCGNAAVDCYFLLGASASEWEKFIGIQINIGGTREKFIDNYFSLTDGEKTIDISTGHRLTTCKKLATSLSGELPKAYRIRLVRKASGDNMVVALWQVRATEPRETIPVAPSDSTDDVNEIDKGLDS